MATSKDTTPFNHPALAAFFKLERVQYRTRQASSTLATLAIDEDGGQTCEQEAVDFVAGSLGDLAEEFESALNTVRQFLPWNDEKQGAPLIRAAIAQSAQLEDLSEMAVNEFDATRKAEVEGGVRRASEKLDQLHAEIMGRCFADPASIAYQARIACANMGEFRNLKDMEAYGREMFARIADGLEAMAAHHQAAAE